MKTIHQIEITAECNLKCRYCTNSQLVREIFRMSEEVFNRCVDVMCSLPEQDIVWLHGCGESLTHPNIRDFVAHIRSSFKGGIKLSTNGILLTPDMSYFLKNQDIIVHVSLHESSRRVADNIAYALDLGILQFVSNNPIVQSTNWAGQVDWPNHALGDQCMWVKDQMGIVLSDGRISGCCVDVNPVKPVADIFDPVQKLIETEVLPNRLCDKCNHVP